MYTTCAGRSLDRKRISGSLPTEIGLLCSLVHLYAPSVCCGLWYTFAALQLSRHLMLVAAVQSMACGRASRAHAACACRHIPQNSISGSLPTEIGLLSSIETLYRPSLCWELWYTFQALQGCRRLVLEAAMHSTACGPASGAHTACACRKVQQNRISGTLPTEIGLLSSIKTLYGPLLCWELESTFEALQGSMHLVLVADTQTGHGMREGKRARASGAYTTCACRQETRPKPHLRLAANRDWQAKQACVSVRSLGLLWALVHF